MFEQSFYERVKAGYKTFSALAMLIIINFSLFFLTIIIPGLQSFEYIWFCITILFYIFVANIFIGVYGKAYWKTFLLTTFSAAFGMGCRLAMEWNEVSVDAFWNNKLLIFIYPIATGLLIAFLAFMIMQYSKKSVNASE